MKEGDKLDKITSFIFGEKLYERFIFACLVSLILGISIPFLVSVWLGISDTPIPSVYMDWVDKVGFITAFFASFISILIIDWRSKGLSKK